MTHVEGPFWDAIRDHTIKLPQCTVCHRWQWYPTDAGADCAGGELVWVDAPTTGTLHTYTRVERAFLPDGQADVPFVVGFIDLEGVPGLRLVANVTDDDNLEIGMPVEATFPDGHLVFTKVLTTR
jgi:hypothetical protein